MLTRNIIAGSILGLALAVAGCASTASLTLTETSYGPGDSITVSYTAPDGYDTSAWIGIIPSEIEHGDETVNDQFDVAYQYLEGETSGTITFTAPLDTGDFDIRMHDSDSNGNEVASVSFTVE